MQWCKCRDKRRKYPGYAERVSVERWGRTKRQSRLMVQGVDGFKKRCVSASKFKARKRELSDGQAMQASDAQRVQSSTLALVDTDGYAVRVAEAPCRLRLVCVQGRSLSLRCCEAVKDARSALRTRLQTGT